MTKMISRGLVLAAGILSLTGPADPDSRLSDSVSQTDPRYARLQKYFGERDCPAQHLAADFIQAADRHNLDWRLLPSLSIVESSGGKTLKNNNMFGYDNCNTKFGSLREGIYFVADRLANGSFYREKNLDAVLRTYNPTAEYAPRVKAIMRELGPALLQPAFTHP